MSIIKGWRTSEFWLALAGLILPVAAPHLDTNSIFTLTGTVVAYILSRGYVKGNAK